MEAILRTFCQNVYHLTTDVLARLVMLFCCAVNNWTPDFIVLASEYSEEEVGLTLGRLMEMEYLTVVDGNWSLILKEEHGNTNFDESSLTEFLIIAAKVAGVSPALN